MTKQAPSYVARCRCGAVEVGAWDKPIAVNACYCDDCQAAARRLGSSGATTANADGGTECVMFRRDRIACTQGADRLQAMRLTEATRTRRMVAGCCGTPMYMAFDDKRPWVSAFRAPFGADAPPVERRICTRFRSSVEKAEDGLPSHPGYPPVMAFRILSASVRMMFSLPVVGVLP